MTPDEIIDATHRKIHEFLVDLNMPCIVDAIALNYALSGALRNLGVKRKYIHALHQLLLSALQDAGEGVHSTNILEDLDKDRLPRA